MTDARETEAQRVPQCGVLAFGSLIWEPSELEELDKVREVICMTPWPVEFAKSSRGRGWAPTLVRVKEGRRVAGRVFLYQNSVAVVKAKLALRERIDLKSHPDWIAECDVAETDVRPLWYTALPPNIDDLRPECLARLAIASVKSCPDKNGILYLRKCLELGIVTALSDAYREEVLRISGCKALEEAEEWAGR